MHQPAVPVPRVSVIIPVLNADRFLERCLDSVFTQTLRDFEVIAVNDGSTDASLEILHSFGSAHPELTVIDQANAGQGAARNRALDAARGEYVLFVDADDLIEAVTLQVTVARADADASDLVHFDWKLLSPKRPGGTHYYNADPFWHRRVLEGPECDELLRVQNLFSVCNLYRREFLNAHGIRFEEGRIYEDNPFVVHAVNRAIRASLVHAPLYTVNPHEASTTRSHTDSDRHSRDHLHAIRRSFELLDRRNPRGAAYLAAYHVKKLGPYYATRIPRGHRREYIREFVDILHEAQITVPPATSTNRPMRVAMRWRVFERRRTTLFQVFIIAKNRLMPKVQRAKRLLRKWKHRANRSSAWSAELERALRGSVRPNTVSFLGLDSAYAGNSRYLFEEMIADPRFAEKDIKFVTADERVPDAHRLDPAQPETYVHLACSELVFAESWIPPRVRKHRDSTWIQLWHGTPIKRMLFDSHEPRIIWNRRHHKTSKYRDIQQWDYLVVDTPAAVPLFETAFLFDPQRCLVAGYPRVQYLLEHRDDSLLHESLRSKLGITGKRVALYAPTWRDVNYGRSGDDLDFSYVLDVQELSQRLGDDWVVLFHDHGYLSSVLDANEGTMNGYLNVAEENIQDLLLMSDVVISDYSSVIFDALAIDRPVVLYVPDESTFEDQRGLYPEVWQDLLPLRAMDCEAVVAKIAQPNLTALGLLRDQYTTRPKSDLARELVNFPDMSFRKRSKNTNWSGTV